MICFAWDGFPQYAARCVGAFVRATSEQVVVVGTRPDVPVEGMEQCCGCKVVWVERTDKRPLARIIGEVPRLIVLSGWSIPAFNRYRDEVRRAGGRAVAMCDNNFVFSIMECLRAIRFRLLFRGKYDGFFVPGKSGVKLLRFYGVPQEKIKTGMYAADSGLFKPGKPLSERPKKMIYVGQLCERKNVKRLVMAFESLKESLKVRKFESLKVRMLESLKESLKVRKFESLKVEDWSLEIYGCGPLKDELLKLSNSQTFKLSNPQTFKPSNFQTLKLSNFIQPEELAEKYREARIFILPSLSEHWGVVVHEAALSGCVLLLSKQVGAADDFLEEGINGFGFDPLSVADIARAMDRATALEDDEWTRAFARSVELGARVGVEKFVAAIKEFA